MKRTFLTTLTLATAFFIASCGSAGTEENASSVETKEIVLESVRLKDATLDAVYQEYLNLNFALVNSNVEEAKIAANTLALGANELSQGKLIAERANDITTAGTLAEQRKAFSDLSDDLITLIKQGGLESGNVYVDYCPMALNNTGAYWLSSEEGIKNPYFGESMLTCGETKETL